MPEPAESDAFVDRQVSDPAALWRGPNGSRTRFGFWAVPRPLTKHWGSGQVYKRIEDHLGTPDAVFGVQDNIPEGPKLVDWNTGYEWRDLPFEDQQFEFGYWDPPYFVLDKRGNATRKPCLFKPEGQEIWRTVRRLAILHTHVYPKAWLEGAEREAMIAVTMGPMKSTRMLNVFRRRP